MQFITEEGGLTAAGYVLFIVIAVLAFAAAVWLAGRFSKNRKMSAKQLAFCAMGIALAYVTSYIPIFKLPFGGSCTLFSMLFIVLIAYWYGPYVGILSAFAYGILQFLQEPYYLSFIQVCFDYLFAFSSLGIAGFFRNRKNGLITGYLAAVLARGFFHVLGGYFFWMEYMPENFPKALAPVYPIVYNYSFLGAEAVLTVVLLLIPSVKKALQTVQQQAVS